MLKMLTENTAMEAASTLGLPGGAKKVKGLIGRKLRSGEWPGRKDGNRWWFDVDEIRNHIKAA